MLHILVLRIFRSLPFPCVLNIADPRVHVSPVHGAPARAPSTAPALTALQNEPLEGKLQTSSRLSPEHLRTAVPQKHGRFPAPKSQRAAGCGGSQAWGPQQVARRLWFSWRMAAM